MQADLTGNTDADRCATVHIRGRCHRLGGHGPDDNLCSAHADTEKDLPTIHSRPAELVDATAGLKAELPDPVIQALDALDDEFSPDQLEREDPQAGLGEFA